MSYLGYLNKKDWETGDLIIGDLMDNLLNGLYDAGQEIVKLSSTVSNLRSSTAGLNTNINNLMNSTANLASSITNLSTFTTLLASTVNDLKEDFNTLASNAVTKVHNLDSSSPLEKILSTSSAILLQWIESILKDSSDHNQITVSSRPVSIELSNDIILTLDNVITLASSVQTLASSIEKLNYYVNNASVPWIITEAYDTSTGKYYLTLSLHLSFDHIYSALNQGGVIYIQGNGNPAVNRYDPLIVGTLRTGLYRIITAYGYNGVGTGTYRVAALVTGDMSVFGSALSVTSPAVAIYETDHPTNGTLTFKCVVQTKLNSTVCSTITNHSILGV